ncbi:hypothetical protein UFOVP1309_88 [uncultured Caudovirales phage]|uniref:Uncharacterized protein n=1 Tax=uncultured Caudovirales phage TaxID=2100421 RepID=A0A6J5RLP3_9CAUD|nr:hypothetical protein UFOVP1309_88 [uncultured Caudovirales phage]
MTTEKQPEALRLADELVALHGYPLSIKAAAELRRQHSVNAELLDALKGMARLYPPNGKARSAIAKAEGGAATPQDALTIALAEMGRAAL